MALKHGHREHRHTDTKHMDMKGCCPGVRRAQQADLIPDFCPQGPVIPLVATAVPKTKHPPPPVCGPSLCSSLSCPNLSMTFSKVKPLNLSGAQIGDPKAL